MVVLVIQEVQRGVNVVQNVQFYFDVYGICLDGYFTITTMLYCYL